MQFPLLHKILGRREILAYIVVITASAMAFTGKLQAERYFEVVLLVVGFYFYKRGEQDGANGK